MKIFGREINLNEYFGSPGAATLVLTITNIILFAMFFQNPFQFCISFQTVSEGQFARIFMHVLQHANIIHLIFNMFSLYTLGTKVEKSVGTVAYIHLIYVLIWVSSLAYLLFDYFAFKVSFWSFLDGCAVGFSGVLFGLLVVDTLEYGAPEKRSIFGVFDVPAALYPLTIILVIQAIIPHASFIGHLSGACAGYLVNWRRNEFLFPFYVRWVESRFETFYRLPLVRKPPQSAPVLPVRMNPTPIHSQDFVHARSPVKQQQTGIKPAGHSTR